jgi:transcriptional regulator with XRE-family HTH domain
MDHRTFLRLAKRELGLSYPELARQLGVSARTIEKWSLDERSPDHRGMPRMATKFLCHLLEDLKRRRVLAGDRGAAEAIDALVSHVDPQKSLAALHTFDALQRSANALGMMIVARNKPRYFKTSSDKNAWRAKEELEHARRIRKASAAAR